VRKEIRQMLRAGYVSELSCLVKHAAWTYVTKRMDRITRVPNSTSKFVFPQAHEMVFNKGQGEQAPLAKKKYVITRTKNNSL
jgi:hypothetical protein